MPSTGKDPNSYAIHSARPLHWCILRTSITDGTGTTYRTGYLQGDIKAAPEKAAFIRKETFARSWR